MVEMRRTNRSNRADICFGTVVVEQKALAWRSYNVSRALAHTYNVSYDGISGNSMPSFHTIT